MGTISALFSKIGPYAIGALLGLLLIASAAHNLRAIVNEAAASARAERDAHWQAEIAKANAAVAEAKAAQVEAASAINQTAADEIARLKTSLTDLEAKNAALPNGDACGLDAARVRLLPP